MSDTYFVYVLRSKTTGRRYVGSCQDLNDRLRRHNAGESKSTRHGVPWGLVYCETFSSRSEAAIRERFFKTGNGRGFLDENERFELLLSTAETDLLLQSNRAGKPLDEILNRFGL